VLPAETLTLLDPQPGETALDCTAGLGGHAIEIARRLGAEGTLVLNDLDAANLTQAEANVRAALGGDCPQIVCLHGAFDEAPAALSDRGTHADVVLADLGFASVQVDDPARGLSFRDDGPLDMRLNPDAGPTAADLVAELEEAELADVLYEFGEERLSRRIARKVVAAREQGPITSTHQLADIVRSAYPPQRHARGKGRQRGSRIDPATRTFQALRIAVNDELGCLGRLLGAIRREAQGLASDRDGSPGRSGGWLGRGARVAVIAFHSLEDRPVKHAFRELAAEGLAEALTRKPARPTDDEVASNPRSRSARLRAIRLGSS